MTPEQLKASIIQSALQGKLVEQRREEGTAEELFKVIQVEKKRLINEKRIKEEKELLEPDEYPYDIPSSWIWARITECGSFISGYTPKPAELRSEGTIPYFKVSDMNTEGNELYLTITNNYLKDDNSKKVYLKNTIVYPKNGGAVFTNKKRILAQDSVVDLNTGGYSVIGPVDLMYFYLYFSQIDFRQCYKGTALPTIDMYKLKKKWVPIPPLEEQHRIVAKIEELLPYVDRYAEAYEKLEQFNAKFPEDMKKSILQYAIQGKLVEQRPEEGTAEELYQQIQEEKQKLIKEGKIKKARPLAEITENEIPFDIPKTWKWVRWGNLSQKIQYGYNSPAKSQGKIKMVRISDIQNDIVMWDTVPYCDIPEEDIESYLLNENDILFARTGGTVGKSFLVDVVPEKAIYAGYLIRSSYSDKICPQYIKYFMGTKLYWDQLRIGTIATAQPNCNGQTLSKMLVPLPPLEEQYRIVAKIEELLPYCESFYPEINRDELYE